MPSKTNAQRQAAYRAKKKQTPLPSSGQTSGDVVEVGEPLASPEGLEVEVVEEEVQEPPKLSFFERTMQKLQGGGDVPQPAKRRGKKSKENLLVTALPTVLASLIVTYASQMFPEEYAECTPRQDEITGIIAPLMEIIGRRVEIAGKVNQDATDIISSILCAFMMGARMYVTYVQIKNEGNPHAEKTTLRKARAYNRSLDREASIYEDTEATGGTSPSLATGIGHYQATRQGVDPNGLGTHGQSVNAYDATNDVEYNGAGAVDDTGHSASTEAQRVADLFRRDKQGRQQLGLLPRAV